MDIFSIIVQVEEQGSGSEGGEDGERPRRTTQRRKKSRKKSRSRSRGRRGRAPTKLLLHTIVTHNLLLHIILGGSGNKMFDDAGEFRVSE